MKNTDTIEVTERSNEITIAFLWDVLRHRLIWLILAVIIGASAMFGYVKLTITPKYSSTAEFAVENIYGGSNPMSSSYHTGAALFAESYAHEITRNKFLEEIAREYNARFDKNVSATWLAGRVSTATQDDLPVFTVKVTSTDPQEAYDILTVFEDLAPTLLLNESTEKYVNVKLIHYGQKAKTPNPTNMLLKMSAGAVVAFLLTYVVFFLIAFLDKTVYSEEALKQSSDLPVVGQIPQWLSKDEERSRGLFKKKKQIQLERGNDHTLQVARHYDGKLLGSDTPFSVSESFKTLRTNLTYVAVEDTTCPVFSVTSDFSGAGKSLVLANLAISFSQLGKRVLLLDGDMRCPTQYKIFKLPRERKGLSEALAGLSENPLEDCVCKAVYESVDVMTAGRIPPNPSELLSSERMKKLLAEAKKKYDYIFIDLPPVLETTDAGVIAPLVSAYILVARAGFSNIDVVLQAVETMRATSANVVGYVLNDVNAKNGFGYYSYGGYGRYGRYSRYSKYSKYGRYSKYSDAAQQVAEESKAAEVNAQ